MASLENSLFRVFDRLRRQGVPLGVEDFMIAVKTLQSGIGLNNEDNLKSICRLLWAKSKEDIERFDQAYEDLMEPQVLATPMLGNPHSSTKLFEDIKSKNYQEDNTLQSNTSNFLERNRKKELNQPRRTKRYQMIPSLSINRRDMAGTWRQYRKLLRLGSGEELDIEKTIKNLCKTGLFLRPVLQPRHRNLARLVVLIDQQGSMTPFQLLVDAFIDSILRGGFQGRAKFYYFHDCPNGILYQNRDLTEARATESVLKEQVPGSSLLILSDAGAARGYYDLDRINETRTFLKLLSNYTYLYVWLNPMPKSRWITTTAAEIARLIPMLHLDREGLIDSLYVLRGCPFSLDEF